MMISDFAIKRPLITVVTTVALVVFVVVSSVFVLNTLVERPKESLAGLGLLALGLPVYWYWGRTPRP